MSGFRQLDQKAKAEDVPLARVHHPAFPQPTDPEDAVWCYLTSDKFKWMVKEGRLFMPNAAHLGDPLALDTNGWL